MKPGVRERWEEEALSKIEKVRNDGTGKGNQARVEEHDYRVSDNDLLSKHVF